MGGATGNLFIEEVISSDDVFKEARERLDIVEVAQRYGLQLDRHGKCLCPFHSEKTPSFTISREKQLWYCFGCNEGGDVIELTAKLLSLSRMDALRQLNDDFMLGLPLHNRPLTIAEKRRAAAQQAQRERARVLQERFDEWCQKACRTLTDYHRMLWYWRRDYAPQSEAAPLNPRFVYSLQQLDRAEYLCDILITGSGEELLDLYKTCGNEVNEIAAFIQHEADAATA